MTVLEQMGELVYAQGGALCESARQELSRHLLDAMGCWIAGSATEEGQALARLASGAAGSIPAFGDNALDQIAIGVGTTRLTEIDDIHMRSCTTPSAVIVPSAMVFAAWLRQSDLGDFAQALSAGYEIMMRWGIAVSGPTIVYRGLWPTYLAAPLGSAAVAARLLKLDATQTANALAMALCTVSGAPGAHSAASPRWLLLGLAARAGCLAALAAAQGYAADRSLLDDDWLPRTHGIQIDRAALVAARAEGGAAGELSFKPYCSAKQGIAAIDGFRDLLDEGIDPEEIERLRISVPTAYAGMIGHHRAAAGHVERITSAAYHLALAAYRRDGLDDVGRPNHASEPQIAKFMDRVEVVADEQLNGYYPQRWPARLEMTLKNGAKKSRLALDARGDPARTLDSAAVQVKFHRLADGVLGKDAADAVAEGALKALESSETLGKFLALGGNLFSQSHHEHQGAN